MSSPQLTSVSYVVLGLVAQGATTSYDMKQKASRSVGYFWNFPHSQLYAEPAHLVELGLLDEEREAEGRRRRVYSLTPAGQRALEDWLREPTSEQPQIRDTGLLKLFFGDGMSPAEITALARAQEEAHRARLAVYEAKADTVTNPNHAAVVRAGLLHERTFAEFWREMSATPP
jgi:PadR family transcriptional regulator, regulatory protein AphA